MTAWADICTEAMIYIDDVRLQDQLTVDPALYYRRMSLFISSAVALLNRPPELAQYIKNGRVDPLYGDSQWTSTTASTLAPETVATGMLGFDLCSCTKVEFMGDGSPVQSAYTVQYDPDTGNVTFPQQEAAGIVYELDFYTDGEFPDLSDRQKRLFGLAVALVWDERFYNTWLNRSPKINDSSFSTVNEANYTEKSSQALLRTRQAFQDELKHYEQDCAYAASVHFGTPGTAVLV